MPHGEVARFYARVSGSPKPEISWFHNHQPVQPTKNVVHHFDEVTDTATLIIVDAFCEHAGEYTCRAASDAGEAVCSATLTITTEEGNRGCHGRSLPTRLIQTRVSLRGRPSAFLLLPLTSPSPSHNPGIITFPPLSTFVIIPHRNILSTLIFLSSATQENLEMHETLTSSRKLW